MTPTDPYSYHEALDRARTISVMIDELLLEHPAVMYEPEINAAVDKLQVAADDVHKIIRGVILKRTQEAESNG